MAAEGIEIQRVVNALLRWRGNVKAAADELGIRRKSLYERIQRAGIDLQAIRHASPSVSEFRGMPRMPPVPRDMSREGVTRSVPKSASAPYQSTPQGPTVTGMQQATAEPPFAPSHSKPRLPRVLPRDQERLRAAKIEIIARFRIETDEQAIHDQFMAEAFDGWLEDKLAVEGARPAERPQRKKAP